MRGARQIALIHHLEGPHRAADGGDTGCLNRVTNDHIANWLSRQIIGDWLWTRYGSEQCDRKRSWSAGNHIERLIVRVAKAQGDNSSVQEGFAKLRREKAGCVAFCRHYRKPVIRGDVYVGDRQLLAGIAVAHNDRALNNLRPFSQVAHPEVRSDCNTNEKKQKQLLCAGHTVHYAAIDCLGAVPFLVSSARGYIV